MTMTASKHDAELRRLENIEEMALEAAIGENFSDTFDSRKPAVQPITYVKFADGKPSKLQQTFVNGDRSFYNDTSMVRKSHKNAFNKVKSEDNVTHNYHANKNGMSLNSKHVNNSNSNFAKANGGLVITNGVVEQTIKQQQLTHQTEAKSNQPKSETRADDFLRLSDEDDLLPANLKSTPQQQQLSQQKALIIAKGNNQIIISTTSQQQQEQNFSQHPPPPPPLPQVPVPALTPITQQEQEFQRRRLQSPPFAPPSTPQKTTHDLQSQQQQQQQQQLVAQEHQQSVVQDQQSVVARERLATPPSTTLITNKEKPAVFSEFPCRDELDVEIETLLLNDDDMFISLSDSASNSNSTAVVPTPRAWSESAAEQLRQYLSQDIQKPAAPHNNVVKNKKSKQLHNSNKDTQLQLEGFNSIRSTYNKENYESGSDQDATSRSEGSLQDDLVEMQYLEGRKLSASWSPDISGAEQSLSPFAYQHPVTNYHRTNTKAALGGGYNLTTKGAKQAPQSTLESNLQKFRLRDHEANLKKKLKQIPIRSKPEQRKSIPLASDPFAASFPSYFQSQTQPKSTVFPVHSGGELSRMNTNIGPKVDANEQRKVDTAKAYVAAKLNEIMFDIPTAAGAVRYRHKVTDVGYELRVAARGGGGQSDQALQQLLLLEDEDGGRGAAAWPFIPGMNRHANEQQLQQQPQQQQKLNFTPVADSPITVKQYHHQLAHSHAGHHYSSTKTPVAPDNVGRQHQQLHRTASDGSNTSHSTPSHVITSKELMHEIPSVAVAAVVTAAEVAPAALQLQSPISLIKPSAEPHPPRKLKPITRKVVNKSRRVSMPNQVAVTTALAAVAKDDNQSVITKSVPIATHEPLHPSASYPSTQENSNSTSTSTLQSQSTNTHQANATKPDTDSSLGADAVHNVDLLPSSTVFVSQIPSGIDILNLEDGDHVKTNSTDTLNNARLKPVTTLNLHHSQSKKTS
jgi:hypothetical protein